MNTFQIEEVCRSDLLLRHKFGGVYSRDTLPIFAENDTFYVCNTDASFLPGKHWVVMYMIDNCREYFDSLGGRINEEEFIQFLGGHYNYVLVQTQEPLSTVCGQYCLFYMCLRVRGYSMNYIVNMLDAYGDDSDLFVTECIKLFYGVEY